MEPVPEEEEERVVEKREEGEEEEDTEVEEEEEEEEEDYRLVEEEFKHGQTTLWSISSLIYPTGDGNIQKVTLDATDYIVLDSEGGVLHPKSNGGFRVFVPVLRNDESVLLFHVEETVRTDAARTDEDAMMPTLSSEGLVKIAARHGPNKRDFRLDYALTRKEVPVRTFRAAARRLRARFKCSDELADKNTLRLYDWHPERRDTALPKEDAPVFDDDDIARVRSEYANYPREVFADWHNVKRRMRENKRKREGAREHENAKKCRQEK